MKKIPIITRNNIFINDLFGFLKLPRFKTAFLYYCINLL